MEKTVKSVDEESMYLCVIQNKSYNEGLVGSQYLKVDRM